MANNSTGKRVLLTLKAFERQGRHWRIQQVLRLQWATLSTAAALSNRRWGISQRDVANCQRFLVIRTDGIGDVLMTLPALRILRQNFPQAQIDAIVRPAAASLLTEPGIIDNVYSFDPRLKGKMPGTDSLWTEASLARHLRDVHYDCALDFAGYNVPRKWTFLSGAPLRAGLTETIYDRFTDPPANGLLTHRVPVGAKGIARCEQHPVDNAIHLLRGLGLSIPNIVPYKWQPSVEAVTQVARRIELAGILKPFAVIHPLSSDVNRNWMRSRYAEVAKHLISHHDRDIVFTGSLEDRDAIGAIIREIQTPRRVHSFAGELSLHELAALYQKASLMVSVDTGPTHLADCVGTPLVALFLPWYVTNHPYCQLDSVVLSAEIAGDYPYNTPPENLKDTGNIQNISVEQVLRAIDIKLGQEPTI